MINEMLYVNDSVLISETIEEEFLKKKMGFGKQKFES